MNSNHQPQAANTPWAPGEFTGRIILFVDRYIWGKDSPVDKQKTMKPFLLKACIVLAGILGAAGHWVFQHARHDTFKDGYQSREIEQFNSTTTYTHQLILSVSSEFAQLQKLSSDGRPLGQIAVFKPCNKKILQYLQPMQALDQLTVEERGNCENLDFPELGYIAERNAGKEPIFYEWKEDHYERGQATRSSISLSESLGP